MQDIFFKLFFIFLAFFSVFSEDLSLDVSVKNGTNGSFAKVEKLKVIALQGGMIPVKEVENVSGNFKLDGIAIEPSSPILLQATYKNNTYNKMIPPTPEFRKKLQEIFVYEPTSSLKNFDIRSLLQIIREQDSVLFYKIYLIENKTSPPLSFYSDENPLKFYIPENAKNLSGNLIQGSSKMPIPLQFVDGISKEEKILKRGILPGISELQISYSLDAKDLGDVNFNDKEFIQIETAPKIIFYKPKKMNVEVLNSKESIPIENDIPEGMGAFKVKYSATGISVKVSGGKPEVKISEEPNSRKLVNGKYFTSWDKSLLGVIAVMGILFSLSFLFVYKKK